MPCRARDRVRKPNQSSAADPLHILLIEDHQADADLLRGTLARDRFHTYELHHAARLSSGLERLAQGGIDVVLLDLALPDSTGIDTFRHVHTHSPQPPIIILTGLDDEALAAQVVHDGAQDYLPKDQINERVLTRSIRYAIGRQQTEQDLRRMRDELEQRVTERTEELRVANDELRLEIAERLRIEAALQQRLMELSVLNNITTAASQSLEIETLLPMVCAGIARLTGFSAVLIYLLDPAVGLIRLRAHHGLPEDLVDELQAWRVGEGITGQVVATGQASVGNFSADVRVPASIRDRAPEWRVYAALPIRAHERILGTLNLASTVHTTIDESELALFETITRQIGIAIDNAELFEQLRTGRERLELLTRRIVTAQEEERRRLSRELHDEAGQALTALKISLELIRSDLPDELNDLGPRMTDAIDLTDATMDQLRSLAQNLRPPALDALGLGPTLEGYCRDFSRRTSLPVDYMAVDISEPAEAIKIGLYRFLQEAG